MVTSDPGLLMGALSLLGCFMSLDNHTAGRQISSVLDRVEDRDTAVLEKYRLGRSQGIHIDVGERGSDLPGKAAKGLLILLVNGVELFGRLKNCHALGRLLGVALDRDGENLVVVLAAVRLCSYRSGNAHFACDRSGALVLSMAFELCGWQNCESLKRSSRVGRYSSTPPRSVCDGSVGFGRMRSQTLGTMAFSYRTLDMIRFLRGLVRPCRICRFPIVRFDGFRGMSLGRVLGFPEMRIGPSHRV
jgi:hypothetical protein